MERHDDESPIEPLASKGVAYSRRTNHGRTETAQSDVDRQEKHKETKRVEQASEDVA